MTLDDLRAQAMDDLTPEQLRAASDAALHLMGWTVELYQPIEGEPSLIWTDLNGIPWPECDIPHPAADLTDAAALMPEGWVVQVNTFDDDAIVTVWRSDDPAFVQNEETACTEPYARMLAAVAAHMEGKA